MSFLDFNIALSKIGIDAKIFPLCEVLMNILFRVSFFNKIIKRILKLIGLTGQIVSTFCVEDGMFFET